MLEPIKNTIVTPITNTKHSFHMVTSSPWPLLTSLSLFGLVFGGVLYMHGSKSYDLLIVISFFGLLFNVVSWWYDIIVESVYEGMHTKTVQRGLRAGVFLFIVSEIMFFFAFFWGFFHSSLSPTIDIGSIWPPKGIVVFNYYDIPLLNTLILLASGATITWAHSGFLIEDKKQAYEDIINGLLCTISLGFLFTLLQGYEYVEAPFSIADSVYGTTFYLATGFHGLHVIIGTIFLCVAFSRHFFNHFTVIHFINFEAAAWYWHFVDVVWLFLFISIYFWGS